MNRLVVSTSSPNKLSCVSDTRLVSLTWRTIDSAWKALAGSVLARTSRAAFCNPSSPGIKRPTIAAKFGATTSFFTMPHASPTRFARSVAWRTNADLGGNSPMRSGLERRTFAASIALPVPSEIFFRAAVTIASSGVIPSTSRKR